MQINLSWILLGVAIAPAVLTAPELSANLSHADQIRLENKAAEQVRRESLRLAEQSKADSEVALVRVQSGCIPVVSELTDGATRLTENVPVKVRDGAGIQFDDGTIICTSLGDTAEVWGGRSYQVKRIAPEHQEEYDKIFGEL